MNATESSAFIYPIQIKSEALCTIFVQNLISIIDSIFIIDLELSMISPTLFLERTWPIIKCKHSHVVYLKARKGTLGIQVEYNNDLFTLKAILKMLLFYYAGTLHKSGMK
jgi:hypothetical protein